MKRSLSVLFLLASSVLLAACASNSLFIDLEYRGWEGERPTSTPEYRVILIGNTASGESNDATLRMLRARLEHLRGDETAVVFLGDDAGPNLSGGHGRLQPLLDVLRGFEGRVVFLPGEQEWDGGREGGLQAVIRREAALEDAINGGNTFLPDSGFPGPVEIRLTDRVTLVVIDTQWWLHPHEKPYGDEAGYELRESGDFVLQLDEVMARHRKNDVLVVGHHPIHSSGEHAGKLPIRDHIFPLARLIPGAYIPLPIIGSAYPLYVRYVGGPQDLSHPEYRVLRRSLAAALRGHERLVYASAHDRGLQYFRPESTPERLDGHFVVSGGGSSAGHVAPGKTTFAAPGPGFAEIAYFEDGSSWLEMRAVDERSPDGVVLFRTELQEPARELVDPEIIDRTFSLETTSVVVAANAGYQRRGLKKLILGSHHRPAWSAPVEVPVLDLGAEGLRPVKRGGGMQSVSLRLQDENGKEYVLRSIDKHPNETIPPRLRGTLATDLVQDQVASLHPYAAFIIPRLAEAAGIYHTRPRLVYVPDDPRLGIYQETFAGRVMLLEERADEDESTRLHLGGSENVISSAKLYQKLAEDNDHRVDQEFYLRSRFFDLLLADWDRHQDQWRWASFEPYELDPSLQGAARTMGKVYRPIPRDRDWAFNQRTGLPSLVKYIDPKFQEFDLEYGSLKGLTLNGLDLDRRFLNELTRDDFERISEELRTALTDEVIERAVRDWPKAIYELDGEETARILKARRDALADVAAEYYGLHARIVDIVGSHKHERFEVTHTRDSVLVVVWKTTSDGEPVTEIYRRQFSRDETREIRLYGRDGVDRFHLSGNDPGDVVLRAVGGTGDDFFIDEATRARAGRTFLYDSDHEGNVFQTSAGVRIIRSSDPMVNRYTPGEFRHNVVWPVTFFGANEDDGIFVGGGARIVLHGFRKSPFAAEHVLKGNIATRTRGFNLAYSGHFVEMVGAWDVKLRLEYLSPENIRNYYGLGNETRDTHENRTFYQAQLTQFVAEPALLRRIKGGASLFAGPFVEFTNVRMDENRFVAQPQAGIAEESFGGQWLVGGRAGAKLETVEHRVNPMSGMSWDGTVDLNLDASAGGAAFSSLKTALSMYYSASYTPQVTVAARVGAAHNIGEFPFHRAVTLGSASNLRGFRSTRFAGRSSFYQNVDLRVDVFRFSNYLAMGKAGIHAFFDNGRVWTQNEHSRIWHQGYGGGLWFELFEAVVIQGTAGFSKEGSVLSFGFGFLY